MVELVVDEGGRTGKLNEVEWLPNELDDRGVTMADRHEEREPKSSDKRIPRQYDKHTTQW